MQKIESYIITWHIGSGAGQLHLSFKDGTGQDVPINNIAEASFLLELLRHDSGAYFDSDYNLIATGIELDEPPKKARSKSTKKVSKK